MTFTHCRGCGHLLEDYENFNDGLCSRLRETAGGARLSCYGRFAEWVGWRDGTGMGLYPYDSPEAFVMIDEWLEKGCP